MNAGRSSALKTDFGRGSALRRAQLAAEHHLDNWGHEPGEHGDYVARELVERVAWSAPVEWPLASQIVLNALKARDIKLSDFERRAVPYWAQQAVRERPSQLEWVPPEGQTWPQAAAVERFAPMGWPMRALGTSEDEPEPHVWEGPLDIRPRLRSVLFDPSLNVAPPSWLVKGLVPKTGISLLYGESSAGKTFLAIHLALCTAYGLPFFGRRVKQAGVVYGAAESGAGVLVRLRAAEAALGPLIAEENRARAGRGEAPLQPAPIRVITEAPNLGPNGDARPLMASVEDAKGDIEGAGYRLGLLVLDTWHAVLGGGDDNASADTGGALRPVRELCDVHGLATLIVGHPGKDSDKGVRGSSALPAAADAIIALVVDGHTGPRPKPSSATRRLTVTKMRDGECGGSAEYRLTVVPLGIDDDGDPWTTCVVEPLGGVDIAKLTSGHLSGQALEVLTLIESFADDAGSANLNSTRQAFMAASQATKPDAGESAHRMAWGRATKKLEAAGRIRVFGGENRLQLLNLDP